MPQPRDPRKSPVSFQQSYASFLRVVDTLPTLSPLLWELQATLQNPLSNAVEIAGIIEKDPGLAANVLKVANSAAFGAPNRVFELPESVARLGNREIERVAANVLVLETFAAFDAHQSAGQFWKHSIRVANICRAVCEFHPAGSALMPSAAHVCGLLHDVGKILLGQYFSEECTQIQAHQNGTELSDAEAERAVLGVDHGEIGAELLELWNLPEELVRGVRFHHAIDTLPEDEQATPALVYFSDTIAHALDAEEFDATVLAGERFSLNAANFERLSKDLKAEEVLLDLMLGDMA